MAGQPEQWNFQNGINNADIVPLIQELDSGSEEENAPDVPPANAVIIDEVHMNGEQLHANNNAAEGYQNGQESLHSSGDTFATGSDDVLMPNEDVHNVFPDLPNSFPGHSINYQDFSGCPSPIGAYEEADVQVRIISTPPLLFGVSEQGGYINKGYVSTDESEISDLTASLEKSSELQATVENSRGNPDSPFKKEKEAGKVKDNEENPGHPLEEELPESIGDNHSHPGSGFEEPELVENVDEVQNIPEPLPSSTPSQSSRAQWDRSLIFLICGFLNAFLVIGSILITRLELDEHLPKAIVAFSSFFIFVFLFSTLSLFALAIIHADASARVRPSMEESNNLSINLF